MKALITVRLDPDLRSDLERLCRDTGRTLSETVREALRRHFRLRRFEALRRDTMPFARARGYRTDDDVTRDVS